MCGSGRGRDREGAQGVVSQHDGLGQWFAQLLNVVHESSQRNHYQHQISSSTNDHYVPGGTNWNGYSLESLVGMVASNASPAQLEGLANRWRTNGANITQTSDDLQSSLTTLMQYWSGSAADQATITVASNANWLSSLGETTTQMAEPIDDSAGALRSAQSTMPGVPHNNWLASAGGGAAAGFMVAGPFGAAAGAVLGGIASVFGFGNKKKEMKKKAVQTMTRFEQAAMGIDGSTPSYRGPEDGVTPGDSGTWSHDPSIPGNGSTPNAPGGGMSDGTQHNGGSPISQIPGYPGYPGDSTTPSFVDSPPGRWTGITGGLNPGGLGPGGLGPGGMGPGGMGPGGVGPGGLGPGGLGPGGMPIGPGGLGPGRTGAGGRGPGGRGGMGGMGPGGMRGGAGGDLERWGSKYGRGMGPGAFPKGLGGTSDQERLSRYTNGLSAAEEEERLAKYRASGALGAEEEGRMGRYGSGAGSALGTAERERMNGRFGRGAGGMLGAEAEGRGGMGGGYGAGGAGARSEEDGEHRRKFPYEEDPFLGDLKAAPPVIGL